MLSLASCTGEERSALDPDADRSAPELLSFEVVIQDQQAYAVWEADEPVRAVVDYGASSDELYRHAYSGGKDYKSAGIVKLVGAPAGTYAWAVRLRDPAGNEALRTLANPASFTVPTEPVQELLLFAMIDVGWGDALFLRAPDGTTTLIDAGHPNDGQAVRRFLADERVTALDFASLTHVHDDHIGGFYGDSANGLNGVFRVFTGGEMPIPCGTFLDIRNKTVLSDAYTELLHSIERHPEMGQHVLLEWGTSSEREPSLRWGSGVRVDLLAAGEKRDLLPGFMKQAETGSVENNDSMVYRVQYGSFVLLLMGDGELETEGFLEKKWPVEFLESSVLKVGHHGANDASSERFIGFVNPRVALIPNALSENPGVEHAEVMERLRRRGADFYASDRALPNRERSTSGVRADILVWTDGEAFTVVSVPTRFE
jgi:competence protein ComEC